MLTDHVSLAKFYKPIENQKKKIFKIILNVDKLIKSTQMYKQIHNIIKIS